MYFGAVAGWKIQSSNFFLPQKAAQEAELQKKEEEQKIAEEAEEKTEEQKTE